MHIANTYCTSEKYILQVILTTYFGINLTYNKIWLTLYMKLWLNDRGTE